MDIFSRLRALESYQRKVEDGRLEQPEWMDAIQVQIDGLRTVHNHLAAVQANLESRTDELEAAFERGEIQRSGKGRADSPYTYYQENVCLPGPNTGPGTETDMENCIAGTLT